MEWSTVKLWMPNSEPVEDRDKHANRFHATVMHIFPESCSGELWKLNGE
jgi:hypothetical protein